MTSTWILAFVITPALVVALGWAAVLLHERALDREIAAEKAAAERKAAASA